MEILIAAAAAVGLCAAAVGQVSARSAGRGLALVGRDELDRLARMGEP